MGTESYHEPIEKLSPKTLELNRALISLTEELQAIGWYQQRIDASTDLDLIEILTHNRNDEVEHAAMLLEWIRRYDPQFDLQLREYLFKTGDILQPKQQAEQSAS